MNPIEQKKTMYLTSLLSETLPADMLTEEVLLSFDVEKDDAFGVINIYFSNQLKTIIDSKDFEDVVDWKSQFHIDLLGPLYLDIIKPVCLLNMAPYTRTVIYSFKERDIEHIKVTIRHWFDYACQYLSVNQLGQIIAFANPSIQRFKDIGKSYKPLRLLMNYRYTIGMGHLVFYDEMSFREDYSITEYKYLQRYETLLSMNNYADLFPIIQDIHRHIQEHSITDSKVIYIFKELMSMTIRHLYTRETTYLDIISDLNTTINDFEKAFDDSAAAMAYLNRILQRLSHYSEEDQTDRHPHIKKTLKIINDQYGENIGLSGIADSLKLSQAYLSRLFKEEMGIGFKDYLTRYRLNIIKDLLEHSNRSIIDIAKDTGYANPDQLTRIFKKYEQMTPSEYRHQLKL